MATERIERYELLGELATGGMATVYLGRPFGFARMVAIKSMHPQLAKDEGFRTMFLDEALLTARIRHANVVPTVDVVSASTRLLLVMEYVEGVPLSVLLREAQKQNAPIEPRLAVAIVEGVLHGLHAAHELRDETGKQLEVIHRDVSPHNILVGVDGVSRLLDFGVAKATTSRALTQTNEIKGKLAYMSPQQISGEPLDRRADVWAAGVVLWEALTSERLFRERSDAELLRSILEGVIDPPSFISDFPIPRELDEVVLKALAKDPARRWPTAEAMAQALADALPPAPREEVSELVRRLAGAELESRGRLLSSGTVSLDPDSKIVADVLTQAAVAVTTPPAPPKGSSRLASLLVPAGAVAILALAGGSFYFGQRAATSGQAPTRATASFIAPSAAPPAETSSQTSGAPAASTAPDMAASAAPDPSATPAHRAPPRAKPLPSAPRSRPTPDCRVPFTVDANGDRHFKPECVQ
jgi:eukaryotic-like serine/threonine-protein kinase